MTRELYSEMVAALRLDRNHECCRALSFYAALLFPNAGAVVFDVDHHLRAFGQHHAQIKAAYVLLTGVVIALQARYGFPLKCGFFIACFV